MNGKEPRIAKLNAVQQTRKKDCIDRTEKAISKLLQNNERVSFAAVARIANVSVSYLYKYPEIKERIQDLRDQQVKNARKLTRPQTASEKSKQVIIGQLRERIKNLEWEKKELKKQNEKMTAELYYIGTKLDLFDRMTHENQRQAEEIKKLTIELENTHNELNNCKIKLVENNPITAVEEYLSTDKKVKSLAGLLRKALEESWIPNLTEEERATSKADDSFSEWFKLAKEQGIVKASQGTSKGILLLESSDEWTPLETIIEQGWTLEYLQERNKR